MNTALNTALENIIGKSIISTSTVSGGDINDAYKITTKSDRFFVKINAASFATDMFEKEAKGLGLIRASETIRVPSLVGFNKANSPSFLILEWIDSGNPDANFWEVFGSQLAKMHRQSSVNFGLEHSNYIGSLMQKNDKESSSIDFLINQRLLPQIELANSHNKIDSDTQSAFDKLFNKLPSIIPDEKPALTHGDLWNGNFMVGEDGNVVLIDPAISYGLREMDLAMTKLFGGFNPQFYKSYETTFPTAPGLEIRIPIYQLYYLMVHVNLFGGGYLNSVKEILKRFS